MISPDQTRAGGVRPTPTDTALARSTAVDRLTILENVIDWNFDQAQYAEREKRQRDHDHYMRNVNRLYGEVDAIRRRPRAST